MNDTCLTKVREQQQDGKRVFNLYIDLWFYICLSYDGVHFNWYNASKQCQIVFKNKCMSKTKVQKVEMKQLIKID